MGGKVLILYLQFAYLDFGRKHSSFGSNIVKEQNKVIQQFQEQFNLKENIQENIQEKQQKSRDPPTKYIYCYYISFLYFHLT